MYKRQVPTAAAGKKKNTKEVDLTEKLFTEIAPKYADRNGGYTRIVKIGQRKGDAVSYTHLAAMNSNNWCNPAKPVYTVGLLVYILLTIFFAYFYTCLLYTSRCV